MAQALVELPKRRTKTFLHPENRDLVLSMVASGFAFTFWNQINVRPSMLSDPGYQDQKEGLQRTMNISLLAILAMAAGLAIIYKNGGYTPAMIMAGTGVGMYLWTDFELNHTLQTGSDQSLIQQSQVQSDAVRAHSMSVLYHPGQNLSFETRALPPKRRKEHTM